MAAAVFDKMLTQHRRTLLAILLMPALAVTIALILIVVFNPPRLIPIVIIIGVILFQYLFLVSYVWRKAAAQNKYKQHFFGRIPSELVYH